MNLSINQSNLFSCIYLCMFISMLNRLNTIEACLQLDYQLQSKEKSTTGGIYGKANFWKKRRR